LLEDRAMLTLPTVVAIERLAPLSAETHLSSVNYQVTFSESVVNVSAADFAIVTTGQLDAALSTSVTGSGSNYVVNVTGLQGNGELRLDLIDDDSIENLLGDPLGGAGAGNGDFQGELYTIDQRAPYVLSINRNDPLGPATGASAVEFVVTLSEAVTGVDASDFEGTLAGGVSANPLVQVAGSGNVYFVTVQDIVGSGTLGLNLVDDGTVRDLAGNQLVGSTGSLVTYSSQSTYPTGLVPNSVLLRDLNFDGHCDLVVTNFLQNTVSVLLGSGMGSFGPQVTYATGSSPVSVASADFNSDGIPDLIVANFSSNSLSLLLGIGNGTFQPQTVVPVGSSPQSVAVTDVDGDGRMDLAVANSAANTLGILFGNGNGVFLPQQTYATDVKPNDVAVSDLNHDGFPDLAVANYTSGSVGVFLNNGNGTFQSQLSLPALTSTQSVAIGDVNSDSHPDLAATNFGSNNVSIWLGVGNGTFLPRTEFAAGWKPQSAALADLNQDGKLDIALVNFGDNEAGVLLGNGNGTFQPQVTFATGTNPQSIAIADVNHDSKPDLAVANFLDATASVLLGSLNGDFVGQAYSVHAATQLQFVAPPSDGVIGQALNSLGGIRVAAIDAVGAVIGDSNAVVTLTLIGGTFAGGGTTAVAQSINGVATFDDLVIEVAGAYSLVATSGPLHGITVPSFRVSSSVVGRRLFYEGSTRFDVTNGQFPGYSNDNAIATDKAPLLSGGGAATFVNVSSYSRGINGIIVDVLGSVATNAVTAADFVFRVGNNNSPQSWLPAPAPSAVSVRLGAGGSGSDRIELFWADGAIEKQWLQVVVLPNQRTGLTVPDVFYFGHALADTGAGNTLTNATVNATDELGVRNNPATLVNNIPVTNLYDFNRDGQVNISDQLLARNNFTTLADVTRFINVDASSGSAVVGRRLFYEGSSRYDVTNGQFPGFSNDNAIATDKVALLPGTGPATFANLSSYSLGITGIMVDLSPGGAHAAISATDFVFKVGNNNTPSSWLAAPVPLSINVRSGAGIGGSDRVEIFWAAGAIRNTWIEVTVRPTAATGLVVSDLFYFGNAVGDTGQGDTSTQATVNATDVIAVRNNPQSVFNNIPISSIYDFNRDGQVNITDQLIARNNPTTVANVVRYLNITNPPAAPEADSATVESAATGLAIEGESARDALRTPTPRWLIRRLAVLGASATDIDRAIGQLWARNRR